MRNKAVFLDRDGVLVESLIIGGKLMAARSLEEFRIVPSAALALSALKAAGYLLVLVTNQPDVATGYPKQEAVEEMHRLLREKLGLDQIEVCYHLDESKCACRKPKPGMLLKAAHELEIDLAKSFTVGDRWRDIDAGRNAGTKTIWIRQNIEAKKPEKPDFEVADIAEAAQAILSHI